MTDAQKAALLKQAMDLLEEADALQQKALGDSDVCEDTHNRIQAIVEDFMYDIMQLEETE
jgi:DNA-binding ferritin-like protein (Dps family)